MLTASYKARNWVRAIRRWVIPYLMSRYHTDRFRPVLSYLYTDYKCNIDCHYCFQHDESREGMTLETARSSIDWLQSVGCRVVAIMGGEPLIRKDFIIKVIRYGSGKGFFVYLPTNGYLMDRNFIDAAGRARVAAINLAVDVVEPKPGLPKALSAIRPQFDYLVKKQKKYGYIIFFNINITSKNIDDVKRLTEIAHTHGIGTDYHVAEKPLEDHSHYIHKDNDFYIHAEQYREFDALIDWLINKQRQDYPMVNSIEHLHRIKRFVRGKNQPWGCRAGHNGSFIAPDGKLAPCFEMFNTGVDWGRIWQPNFNKQKLTNMKNDCSRHCLSTCYQTMSSYYDIDNVSEWVTKHTLVG